MITNTGCLQIKCSLYNCYTLNLYMLWESMIIQALLLKINIIWVIWDKIFRINHLSGILYSKVQWVTEMIAFCFFSTPYSQMPVQGPETETPGMTSLPAKVELATVSEQSNLSTRPMARPLSPSASLGEPEEDEGTRTHSHSHSPASSSCSATYTNLGMCQLH